MREWFNSKIRYFRWEEFGPQPEKNNKLLMVALDNLRALSNTPISIHCTWEDGGHSDKSYHYTGNACDFHFIGHKDYVQQYVWITKIPDIKGIGFYPDWNNVGWHVDLRTKPIRWAQVKGKYIYDDKVFSDVLKKSTVLM